MLTVITPAAAEELGPEQFAVGRPNAVVEITHSLEAENGVNGKGIIGFDIANAFGSMSRGAMGEDFMDAFPELSNIVSILLSSETPLLWEDGKGCIHDLLSQTGVDQGCPLSLILFLFGMRRVLRRTRQLLQEQGGVPEVALKAYVDDVYAACKAENIGSAIKCFRTVAKEQGMTINMSKLKIWGVPKGALPEEFRAHHVDVLPLLGNTVARSDGRLHVAALGDKCGAFRKVTHAVQSTLERLRLLHENGLPLQTTQALARLVAQSRPQHVIRGSRVPSEFVHQFDNMIERFWHYIAAKPQLNRFQRVQLHLPLRDGGLAAGGIEVRAEAAFLAGSTSSLTEVKRCTGLCTVNQLQQAWPARLTEMNDATALLVQRGAGDSVNLWQSDQPCSSAKPQKEWTSGVQQKLRSELLEEVPEAHAAAVRSGGTSEGSRFLNLPSDPGEKMADDQFRVSLRRRLGLTPLPASWTAASTCQNVKGNGSRCGAMLDPQGHHAATCEAGGALLRRHDVGARDLLAKRLSTDLGLAACKEQRCPHWDRQRGNGTWTQARLDIVVPIASTVYYVDITVVDPLSNNAALLRQRARKDGAAAEDAADDKLRKYPGATTIPFAIESYGRLGRAAKDWLQIAYHEEPQKKQAFLNHLSVAMQNHTACMILAAYGAPAVGLKPGELRRSAMRHR